VGRGGGGGGGAAAATRGAGEGRTLEKAVRRGREGGGIGAQHAAQMRGLGGRVLRDVPGREAPAGEDDRVIERQDRIRARQHERAAEQPAELGVVEQPGDHAKLVGQQRPGFRAAGAGQARERDGIAIGLAIPADGALARDGLGEKRSGGASALASQ